MANGIHAQLSPTKLWVLFVCPKTPVGSQIGTLLDLRFHKGQHIVR